LHCHANEFFFLTLIGAPFLSLQKHKQEPKNNAGDSVLLAFFPAYCHPISTRALLTIVVVAIIVSSLRNRH
jgi:hypothetical protein